MAENGGQNRLTRKQVTAITALLSTQTVAQAAALVGIGERTVTRWLAKPHFQEALSQAGQRTIDEAIRRLTAGRSLALDTLFNLMQKAASENVKRLAAKDWLEVLNTTQELNTLGLKIQELEERLDEISKRTEEDRATS